MNQRKTITFVTSNKGKISSAQHHFKDNIILVAYNHELIEPRTDDIQEIAKAKVMQAYDIVKKPCIAMDVGFYIEAVNGFPRAFVNFALDTIGIKGMLKLIEKEENRKCSFKECLAYYDGRHIKYFFKEHKGKLSYSIKGKDNSQKWSDLWYIFIPEDSTNNKVLAQYSNDELIKHREDCGSSIKEFAKWYEDNL